MQNKIKKIIVIGLGYIGLPTASLLATKGYQVVGIDIDEDAVNTINNGGVHIVEPELDILVKSAVNSGNLKASLVPEEGDVFIIAVPTPFKEDCVPDLSYVETATSTIAPYVGEGDLVILESTSPVGTTERVRDILAEEKPELFQNIRGRSQGKIMVAHCPERVLPGQILKELVSNDRIIGGVDRDSGEKTAEFYKSFVSGQIFLTDARTAELAKLTENSFRDINIAFANELSLICDKLNINVWELISLANRHPRVNILQPGPGVGGHCIAVDPWFIVNSAPEHATLIRTARNVNDSKPAYVIQKVKAKADRFKSPKIACFGLAFKADIDDLRESPALRIVRALLSEGIGTLFIVEPNIPELPTDLQESPEVVFVDAHSALEQADIIVGLVDHKEFKLMDLDLLKEKIVIDLRGMWR